MKRKLCGNILVNPMGFGGIPIQRISKEKAKEVLNACLDRGINFIDTARVYTDSEAKISQVVDRKSEFFIATKGLVTTKAEMEKEIKLSIKTLKMQPIDLYQIHNIGEEKRLKDVMKADGAYYALKEAQETGLINHIGMTSHKPEIAMKAIATGKFETVQVPFNIIEKQHLKVIEKAKELGVGTIIMKPLAGGTFKNSVAALKWVLQHDVSVIIPGMDTVQQVHQNAALAKDFSMSEEESKKLEEEAAKMGKNV